MASGITLREAEESDLPNLTEFLNRGFPQISRDQWMTRFDMFWADNPAFNQDFTPRGWVLNHDSQIVGFYGNIPVKFYINQKEALAAGATSWYVDPQYRGIYSMQIFSAFHKQSNVDLFLHTTPNNEVQIVLPRYQFSRLILPFNCVEFLYILDYFKALKLFLQYKSRGSRHTLAKESRTNCPRLLSKFPLKNLEDDTLTCSVIHEYDKSFEELWKSHLGEKRCFAELSRDTQTMNWLYFSKAIRHKRRVIQCRNSMDSSLLGYIVFDIITPYNSTSKIFKMVDMFIPNLRRDVIEALISYAIFLGKKEKVAIFSFSTLDNSLYTIFEEYFKFHRTEEDVYFYKFHKNITVPSEEDIYQLISPSLLDPDRGCL